MIQPSLSSELGLLLPARKAWSSPILNFSISTLPTTFAWREFHCRQILGRKNICTHITTELFQFEFVIIIFSSLFLTERKNGAVIQFFKPAKNWLGRMQDEFWVMICIEPFGKER